MDFTKLSNRGIIAKYAIPHMIGLIFNSIYFIIDGIFIGVILGANALAAAGVAVPVVEIMIAISMLIAVGTGVNISSSLGKNDIETANKVFNKANLFTLFLSFVIVVVGNIFLEPLSRYLGATDLIIEETMTYLRYFIIGSPFLVFSFTLSTYARNDNAPRLAMWALIVGSISNIILDWVFMVPLKMGMAGAALATALGPVFSVLIILPHFLMKKGNLSFKLEWFNILDIKDIMIKGLSAFITNFSIGLVTLFYNLAIIHNGLGETTLSSYVIIGYISLTALTAFLGSSQGIQPALSYFLGTKDDESVVSLAQSTVRFNIIFGVVIMFVIWVSGNPIIRLFASDKELIHRTHRIANIYFTNLAFAAFNIVIATVLQAINYQKESTILSLMRATLPLMILLMVLPLIFGAESIWLAMTGAEVITAVFSYIICKKYLNKLRDLENKEEK